MWKEIVKNTLIGTQRGKISESDIIALSGIGINTNVEPAKVVLQAAAILGQMQRVGKELPKRNGGLPTAAPEEKLEPCSDKAANNLTLMLSSGKFAPALPEFLRYVQHARKILPPESLPQVLNKCLRNDEMWESIKNVIGERGKWLAEQHPVWKKLIEEPIVEDWEISTKAKRLDILDYLRKRNPQQALALIESTWSEDSFQDRQYFLDTLHTNLSIKDEAFLEQCLDDSRKEIRQVAALLLSKIEDSALNERLFQEALSLVELKTRTFKKPKLAVTIPEVFKKEWKRDGIHEKSHLFQFGQKANWLGQIIHKIPPQKWDTYFKTSPEETLDLFVRSDWSELLLQSLINATVAHKNTFWAEAILVFWIKKRNKNRFKNVNIQPIFKVVSKPLFNKICLLELTSMKGYIEESEDIMQFMMAHADAYAWEDNLAKAFYYNLVNWLARETRSWNGWHYRTIMKKMVFNIRPQLHREFVQSIPMNSKVWSHWQKDFEAFFTILQFRKEMIEKI